MPAKGLIGQCIMAHAALLSWLGALESSTISSTTMHVGTLALSIICSMHDYLCSIHSMFSTQCCSSVHMPSQTHQCLTWQSRSDRSCAQACLLKCQ